MLKRTFFFTALFIAIQFTSFAQDEKSIQWKSLEEVFELSKKEARPIIVDVYTDWCVWCRHMTKTTFSNLSIINYINTHFYAAKFNAETLDTITFKGKKYINRRIGRKPTHDFAIALLDGKLSYPTIVYFDKKGNKMVVPGYKEPKDIEAFLVYFAENIGETASIDNFMINYMYSFPQAFKKDHSIFKIDKSLRPDTLGVVEWFKPDAVLELSKKKKKPIMVYLYTDWCIGCKVMDKTSFGNTKLAKQINKNYYPVKVNAASEEEFSFLGNTYKGTGKNQPNELVKKYLNNYQMPAVLFFDENYKFISRINGYLQVEYLLPLTKYFHDKVYTKMSFQDYMKDNGK